MTSRRRILLAGLALAWSATAFGHAALVRSEPGSRAVLTQPPKEIRLWFNERIEGKYSSIRVEDEVGKPVAVGRPTVDAADRYRIGVSLPPLRPAAYTVRYRVLSRDGHVIEYGYKFRIEEPAVGR